MQRERRERVWTCHLNVGLALFDILDIEAARVLRKCLLELGVGGCEHRQEGPRLREH
jgi:hypothetical protein